MKKRSIFGHTKRKQCGVKEEEWEKRFTILLFNRRKSEERKKDGKRERESSYCLCVFFQKDIQLHGPSPDVPRRLLFFFSWIVEEQTVTTHTRLFGEKEKRRGWMRHHSKIWNHYIISERVRIHRNERNA
jgi:hypothetical protein